MVPRRLCHFFWITFLLPAEREAAAVDFEKEIRPIFEARCLDCHDRETLKGGIGLETYYHAQLPTDAGEPLFVPGQPDHSVLLHVVKETDPEKRMPPKGKPLDPAEIDLLERWIGEGAVWPDDGWRPPKHWSYVVPQKSPLPGTGATLTAGREGNEIDAFIAARLAEHGLGFNVAADPARLLRRVHLDLTGLPPTVAEADAFLADPSFEHYVRIVDALLASPHFGEKWAVPWLDLARYADSEGYQRDAPRNMWPWRDWVIAALNSDLPFDQFTIEQLAGDLLPNATEAQKVATGFHCNTPLNLEAGTDPDEDHYKRVVDRVNTTGTIWLGSTIGCAQCHNHKYDPITTKEYYELSAFFNQAPPESRQQGMEMGMLAMVAIGPTLEVARTMEDIDAELKAEAEFEAVLAGIRGDLLKAVDQKFAKNPKARAALPKDVQAILAREDDMDLNQCRTLNAKLALKDRGMGRRLEEAEIMETRLKEQRKKEVRVMVELAQPRATFVAKRGDFLAKGEEVRPATPASLHPFGKDLPRNRLGLARWLVDPANPLVGRAHLNRIWIELFGQGLVTTPEDFGAQGEKPTHPELLDWLAATFVSDDGWSTKRAVRRIVLSATYRQSIVVNDKTAEVDPRNQLLWRHPGQRLGAEMIRDQALAISGLLDRRLFGVNVRPYQPATFWRKSAGASETYYVPSQGSDAHRRGVYTLWRRNAHYPSFANFDAPDRTACVVQRDVSNTPLQALTLLNDPVYVGMATAFGQRISKEGGATTEDRIGWAFRTALTRHPTEPERQLLLSAFETVRAASGSEEEAWREVATILLNLHETINRS
ncbi:MAG: PSD1 domain-containing protein [Verrucomicrobiales bacterium]|nr:PSD1 domain-containing protein [Verrucomicrobiales bacterium]